MHDDKTHEELDEKETRKKRLEGRLEREDCDNQEMFELLQLLKSLKNQLKISLIPWINRLE